LGASASRAGERGIPDDERLTIGGGVYRYLEQMAADARTISGHRHSLEEFQKWSGTTYVENITRAELLRFKDWLQKTRKNDELTAVWKIIRVNKFYKWALGKEPGEGLVKTASQNQSTTAIVQAILSTRK
jgi:site-specific recombinase XerD